MLKERLAKMKADEEKEYAAEGPQFNSPGTCRPPSTAPARAPVVRRPQIDGAPNVRRSRATCAAIGAGVPHADRGQRRGRLERRQRRAGGEGGGVDRGELSRLPDDDDDSDGEDGGLNFS